MTLTLLSMSKRERTDATNRRPTTLAARLAARVWGPLPALAFLALLFVVWHVVVAMGAVSEFILPPPLEVWDQLVELGSSFVTGGFIWDNFLITAYSVLAGFVLAAIAGVGLGALVAKTAFGRRVIKPFLVALYSAPKVAIAPVLVAWFGFGVTPKIAMGALIAFFPLLVDTVAGLSSLEDNQRRLFKVIHANPRQTFLKLELPTALPFIFAGLKSAAVLAVIGVIVGEYMGGGDGLGALILAASTQLALDRVFAYVLLLSVFSYAFYLMIDRLERWLVYWQRPHDIGGLG
jgi:NitT/TauT family transport system permease protein